MQPMPDVPVHPDRWSLTHSFGPVGSGRPSRSTGPGGVGKAERQRRKEIWPDTRWPEGCGSHPCSGNATSSRDPTASFGKVTQVSPWNAFERDPSGNAKSERSRSRDPVNGPALPPDQATRGHLDKVCARNAALSGGQRDNGGERPLPPPPPGTRLVRPRSPSPTRECASCGFIFSPCQSDEEDSDAADPPPLAAQSTCPGRPTSPAPDPKDRARATQEARTRPPGRLPRLPCEGCAEPGETSRRPRGRRHPSDAENHSRPKSDSGDPPGQGHHRARDPLRPHPTTLKGVRFSWEDHTPRWQSRIRTADGRLCDKHSQLLEVLEDLLAIGVLEGVFLEHSPTRCGPCKVHTTSL